MIKLIAFDLDGTLAELGKGITNENLQKLKKIEKSGIKIAICSGKPSYYLCGFLRQVGLENPIIIGENGATIQFGVDLPPKKYYVLPYEKSVKQVLRYFSDKIEELFPEMFFQPNSVGLTPFPKNDIEFDAIQKLINENMEKLNGIKIYRHIDSFDFVPNGIDKFTGLTYLGNILSISRDETIAVGDGVNDYPMFEYAKLSLGIHLKSPEKVTQNFRNIDEALDYIIEKVNHL